MEARARELGDYKTLTQLDAAPRHSCRCGPRSRRCRRTGVARHGRHRARRGASASDRLPDRGLQTKIESRGRASRRCAALAVNIAQIESGGNPNAVSPSGKHRGMFQLSRG
jgi:hypothetical protein